MNYDQAIVAQVTRQEAIREVQQHNISVDEFLEEVGDKETYKGSEVLNWLGY